jgi:hypothetical protein
VPDLRDNLLERLEIGFHFSGILFFGCAFSDVFQFPHHQMFDQDRSFLTRYLLLPLFAIIRIIPSLFPITEPVFSRRAVQLTGGAMRIFRGSLLFFCCLLALSACGTKKSTVENTLGPDGKRIKASQRPYTVYGQRYEPLRSHEGFVQTGVASWYGKDFHGKKRAAAKHDMRR